jgi:hypothetical protein
VCQKTLKDLHADRAASDARYEATIRYLQRFEPKVGARVIPEDGDIAFCFRVSAHVMKYGGDRSFIIKDLQDKVARELGPFGRKI